jgi:sulfur carrier protein
VKIVVNGEAQEIHPETTVRGLIELLSLGDGPVAVERNGEIVPRANHAITALCEADVIEIVHFVGGG